MKLAIDGEPFCQLTLSVPGPQSPIGVLMAKPEMNTCVVSGAVIVQGKLAAIMVGHIPSMPPENMAEVILALLPSTFIFQLTVIVQLIDDPPLTRVKGPLPVNGALRGESVAADALAA